jgi:hypothetical protein
MLHDRTYRAVANRSSFLTGSDWQYETFLGDDYNSLFFDGSADALRTRAESVMANPVAHRERCVEFGRLYKQQYSLFDFVKHLEMLGDKIRAHANIRMIASLGRR